MFKIDKIRNFLQHFPTIKTLWVAYSGGVDSHVLLHALATLKPELPDYTIKAIYINHQLSPQAEQWANHCQMICQSLKISFQSLVVNAKPVHGKSPEAIARAARYEAFAQLLTADDGLITAHHLDDQAETFLLQLFRGAGLRGLSAMAECTSFAKGYLLRPLLKVSRVVILDYARAQGLQWINDESNENTRFDRNFLRQVIMPQIQERWVGVNTTIARAAEHCAEAEYLLHTLAEQDLIGLSGAHINTLLVKQLCQQQQARRRNVLRYWFHKNQLDIPSTMQLQHLEQDVLFCREDAMPKLVWGNVEIRRYRDELYIYSPPLAEFDNSLQLLWNDLTISLMLPQELGCISSQVVQGKGLVIQNSQQVSIRFRQGGERCQPHGRKETHELKNLFQEWGIPPWLRERIPLLYIGEQLASVVGYCDCEPFVAHGEQQGWFISHQPLTIHSESYF